MKIHLLGSEGFIGRAIQREASDHELHCWSHRFSDPGHYFDLLESSTWEYFLMSQPRHVILLSWPGLPNYHDSFHLTRNLPASVHLIDNLRAVGVQRLVVSGTCYEYGLQNGPLKETQLTDPVNSYAIAKDSLRRSISNRIDQSQMEWCWSRIFYPYGHGQNKNSLLPSLQRAISSGETTFKMSSGRQVRDYIPVTQVARFMLKLASNSQANGVYNCGSGHPLTLRELAEQTVVTAKSSILLKFDAYPDRTDEPFAFWADTTRMSSLD